MHGGIVHLDAGQGRGRSGRTDSIADGHVFKAGHDDDVAGMHFVHVHHVLTLIDLEAGGTKSAGALVFADADQRVFGMGVTVADAAYGKAAKIVGIVEVGHEHMERFFRIVAGGGDILEDGVEKDQQIPWLP